MAKYLDENGLLYLWNKLKGAFVARETGKALSSNDYTDEEKTKLAGIAAGATNTVIHNTLTSTSTTEALSAAQGKVLNDKISGITGDLEALGGGDMMKATYDVDADGVVDNAQALGGHPAGYFAPASSVPTKTSDLANDSGFLTAHQDISGKLDTDGDGSSVTVTFQIASGRTAISTGDTLATSFGRLAKWLSDLKDVAFSGAYADLSGRPTIPTTVAQLTDAGNYALKTEVSGVYKYKGSVTAASNLPSSGNTAGDVYNVEADGMNYAWTGESWDALGAAFEVERITNTDIDSILSN